MMTCRDVTALASQHLDGELPIGKRLAIRMHVLMCRHCRRYLRQLRATVLLLGTLRGADAAPTPPSDALIAGLAALPDDDGGDSS